MTPIRLTSPAKINLTLDVLGFDQSNQKHFVNTILYRDDQLADEIVLRKRLSGFRNTLTCSDPTVPTDRSNTLLRALELLQETGWEVDLYKNIPIQAGLGGASSNAAAVIRYFGEKKQLTEQIMLDLAQRIGADVPFFVIADNLAYFEGFGDQYIQSWYTPPLKIEYLSTGINVPTKTAYQNLDLDKCAENSRNTELLLKLINETDEKAYYQLLTANYSLFHNDFESSFFAKYPEWRGRGHLCGSGGFLWELK